MTGAANRRRGNKYEVELSHYLTPQLDVDVYTSRDGRGGAQGGADLISCDGGLWVPHVRGWVIEAKARKTRAVPTWLRQAKTAADGITPWWCVFHRNDGTTDRATDTVYLPRRMLLDFLVYQEPIRTYSPDEPYLELTAGQWCEVAS